MATYEVQIMCNKCGETHPLGIHCELDDGPVDEASIGDTYAGKPIPENLATISNNKTRCPNTGKMTMQEDHSLIFLVAIK